MTRIPKIAFDCIWLHSPRKKIWREQFYWQLDAVSSYRVHFQIYFTFKDLMVRAHSNGMNRYQNRISPFSSESSSFYRGIAIRTIHSGSDTPTASMATIGAYFRNESFQSSRRNTLDEEMNEKIFSLKHLVRRCGCEWTFRWIPLLHVSDCTLYGRMW